LPWQDRRTAALLVGVVAFAVYANSLLNGFAYDDAHIIVTNEAIHSLETLPAALRAPYWPVDYGKELGLWRPGATAAYGIQYALGGGAPWLFHLVNVLAHVGASLLVLTLLSMLMSLPAALVGGMVFAVHPVHVEAVANVVGFAEIASTAAVLGACIVHLRAGQRSGWASAMVVGLLYALGFGTKEGAVTLPGLIFLLDAARGHIGLRELPQYLVDRWRVYAVMLAVAIALLAMRLSILGSLASAFPPLGAEILGEIPRIWTLGEIWLHYVRLWVFPLDLSADYSPGVIPVWTSWGVENALGAGLALLILLVSLLAWRRGPMSAGADAPRVTAFGVVWFMIAVSPVSNTLFLSGVLLAERTLYLPSVGLAAGTGWLAAHLYRERPRVAVLGVATLLLLGSVRTWTRNASWRDSVTMFTVLLEDVPQSGRSQWVLGDMAMTLGHPTDALRSYRVAIDLLGTDYQFITEISKRLLKEGHYRAAEGILRYAVVEHPEFPLAFSLLASSRAEHGDAPGAERYARRSLELSPGDAERLHLLAWSLAAQGRFDEAVDVRSRADREGPVGLWQQYMYRAYRLRAVGDSVGAYALLDSAWARVVSPIGQAALDSVTVSDFGQMSRLTKEEGVVPAAPEG
jgi:tetratricopeptide (TPR) repeat protein